MKRMSNSLTNGGATRMKTTPLAVQRTARPLSYRALTSFEPGYMIPVLAIPLFREDSVKAGIFKVAFEMQETVEVLMNSVHARVLTYLVPKTAMGRHDSMDAIDKSYSGLPQVEGGTVVPWFNTMAAPAHGANALLKKLGKHARPGTTINTDYIEAYNAIWNFRAKNRSPDITQRTATDATLARAFWLHQNFAHIVPDFDQGIIDGQVPLNVVNSKMPVRGLAASDGAATGSIAATRDSTGATNPGAYGIPANGTALVAKTKTSGATSAANHLDVWAELQDNGITISLSNLELARKTQAYANLRRQYNGHSEEYIIDLLMNGVSIPDQSWKQPILLGDQSVPFGMSKRYATDGASLTETVVNGMTMIEQAIATPRVPMGGVVMMVVEVTPEQLFERQKDYYLHATQVEQLPSFMRDDMDPEKVSIVKNEDIDLDHDTPNNTFGYAPLNWQWAQSIPQIGGRFYRPAVDAAFDEDRQRIWAVETQNPVLSEDFYICKGMHQKPFMQTTGDNFDVLVRGDAVIRGNTVFGGALVEATNDYEIVAAKAPMDRIEKP